MGRKRISIIAVSHEERLASQSRVSRADGAIRGMGSQEGKTLNFFDPLTRSPFSLAVR